MTRQSKNKVNLCTIWMIFTPQVAIQINSALNKILIDLFIIYIIVLKGLKMNASKISHFQLFNAQKRSLPQIF